MIYNEKICLGLSSQYGQPEEQQLLLLKQAGFDGFFVGKRDGVDIPGLRAIADREGMIFQSIHAPFKRMKDIWSEDPALSGSAISELLHCAEECAAAEVPILVVHAFIGFHDHSPTPQGLAQFEKLVKRAEDLQIKIAYENTEGEEYLHALMQHFQGSDAVGFCWDTGHEMCYNHSRDLLAIYGDRLLCTHLNDNLGIHSPDGNITYLDDLHLLPFDGIADWESIATRLNRCGFCGELTFELNTKSKPNRHENDCYGQMPLESYFAEAYRRACRFAALKNGIGK